MDPRVKPEDDGGKGGGTLFSNPAVAASYFFFVALSLFFTCDPSVGGALAATLSFLGLRVSLLLRT